MNIIKLLTTVVEALSRLASSWSVWRLKSKYEKIADNPNGVWHDEFGVRKAGCGSIATDIERQLYDR